MDKRNSFMRRRQMLTGLGACALSAVALTAAVGPAHAQSWPDGSIQLVVPAKPGGGTDAGARIIAAKLQDVTGENVVVVNNPGGGGAVAAEQVRTAEPDGNTLLYYHSGFLSTYHTGGYNHSPVEEFTTIGTFPVGGSFALVVNADSEYETTSDLVEAAKEDPGSVTVGVQLRGGSHFMAGLLQKSSGAEFRLVEAGSDADKWVQVQGNQIEAAFTNTPGSLPFVENGDLRILGTIAGSPERDPGAPDVPSLHEQGYEDAVYGLDFLVLGPDGMKPELAAEINAAFTEVLNDDETSEQLAKMRMPISPLGVDASRSRLQDSSEKVLETAKMLGLTD
jgi:tripartite-type tricarboxylate transporter receptor subunit TctC